MMVARRDRESSLRREPDASMFNTHVHEKIGIQSLPTEGFLID